MIQNEKMFRTLCQVVAQTFAKPLEWVLEESKKRGIEAVIEELEQNVGKLTF
jgi:hypothetical protein